jgi:D-alanine-D-alanine ligase
LTPSSYGQVAVLMGGNSNEREISLQSGHAVLRALLELSIDAFAFDTKHESLTGLKKYDSAFICLHGKDGEDGKIQSILDAMGIRYTGSNAQASAYGMDKYKSKEIFLAANIPTPKFLLLNEKSNFRDVSKELDNPFFIKASNSGSSIGVYKVSTEEQFQHALHEAKKIDDIVFAEENISGRELTIPIIDNEVLPVIEIIPNSEFYNYEAKYIRDDTQFICPADIQKDLHEKINKIALASFKALGCSGWGRVDFLVDSMLNVYVIEINTIPGMTSHSLVPLSAKTHGISFNELVLRILQTAYVE